MTSVAKAVRREAACGPFGFLITLLKLRRWKIPPDVTTEETEKSTDSGMPDTVAQRYARR